MFLSLFSYKLDLYDRQNLLLRSLFDQNRMYSIEFRLEFLPSLV